MKKYFSLNYHLIFEMDLPTNSFLINDEETNVPCIFQIWQYKEEKRKIALMQKIARLKAAAKAPSIMSDVATKNPDLYSQYLSEKGA